MARKSMTALAVVLGLASGDAFAKSAQDFINEALQGDNSEIMLGLLGQQKGASQATRDFGQMLVNDHMTAKQEVLVVAKSLGVAPTDDPTPEATQERAKLDGLTGGAFDREFASYMTADHKKDIQAFEEEARGSNGPTSALAAKQLPVLRHHLQMAEAAQASGATGADATADALQAQPTRIGPNEWRASKLAGVAIYGPDNKKVGTITDVVMGRSGKADYVVVGVGGFLGLGEKDIAVPFDHVNFEDQPIAPAGTAQGVAVANNAGVGAIDPASPVGLGTPAAPAGVDPLAGVPAGDAAARGRIAPDHGVIALTADQLKSAPAFRFAR